MHSIGHSILGDTYAPIEYSIPQQYLYLCSVEISYPDPNQYTIQTLVEFNTNSQIEAVHRIRHVMEEPLCFQELRALHESA
jgi:hypothetical protein